MLVILVEGSGDARALPVLFSRNGKQLNMRCVDMRGKSNVIRLQDGFERTIKRQCVLGGERFVVLLDRDQTFAPYASLQEEEHGMQERARDLSNEIGMPVRIFWAVRAFESWLIGGIRRGDDYCGLKKLRNPVPGDTQAAPQRPKEWIVGHLVTKRYNENTQVCLTSNIDWKQAKKRNKSLRDFLDHF